MRYRTLGRTGVKVSGPCFGTMPFGTETDEDTAAALFGRRSNRPYQVRCGDPAHYEVAERLVAPAGAWGRAPAAWATAHPAVTAPSTGARTLEELGAVLTAAEIDLSAEQRRELSALTPPPTTDPNQEAAGLSPGLR